MRIKLCTYILLIIVLLLNMNCKSQCNYSKVSEDIFNVQKSEFGNNIFLEALNRYRGEIKCLEKLNYSSDCDTIFVLELSGVQGDYNFTSWNKVDTISYTNETGIFEMRKEPLFSRHMMMLVSKWDILKIKEEEKNNSNFIPNEIVYATRIVFLDRKYVISSIYFKDFFNYERDIIIRL